jgi:hypothetical protein
MQSALQTILASATLANLHEKEYERVRISGPVSLRRFMQWDAGNLDKEFVDAMTEYTYIHSRTSDLNTESSFSWDTARSVRSTIQTELDKCGNDSVTGLLRYVSNIQNFFTEQVGKERGTSLELSNVGVWKTSAEQMEQGWKIGRCVFSQSPNVTGAAIAVSAVTGGDGCLVLLFTWHNSTVENMFVEKVVRSVEQEVQSLLNGEGN